MNDKLLRAFIEAQGYEIEEVKGEVFVGSYAGDDKYITRTIDYKVTKKETGIIFTKDMVENIINVLSDYTSTNGRNNDDVLNLINTLEAIIDENI